MPLNYKGSPLWKILGLTFALSIVSLFVGVGELFIDAKSSIDLIFVSRLPRTLAVLLTGASLALAGTIMQALARNKFVDPMIFGSGQSAAIGILVTITLMPQANILLKMVLCAITSLIGTFVFLQITKNLPKQQPFLLPLVGIIYGGILGAIATAVGWHLDLLQFLEIWLNGEFSGVVAGRYEILWVTAILMILGWWIADQLTIYSLGHGMVVTLGLNYKTIQGFGLIIVSIIAGCTIVTVGLIPFVGLVVPAFVSRLWGENIKHTLPIVASSGALLVLISDLIGRVIRFPYEVPAGTIMGVIGAIAFLVLLFKRFD